MPIGKPTSFDIAVFSSPDCVLRENIARQTPILETGLGFNGDSRVIEKFVEQCGSHVWNRVNLGVNRAADHQRTLEPQASQTLDQCLTRWLETENRGDDVGKTDVYF